MRSIYVSFNAVLITVLCSCAANVPNTQKLSQSYLKDTQSVVSIERLENVNPGPEVKVNAGYQPIPKVSFAVDMNEESTDFANQFSEVEMVNISSNELALPSFLHYIFGEVLKTNYLFSDSIKKNEETVTLNIQQAISKRRLFIMVNDLLMERGFFLHATNNIIYIGDENETKSKLSIVFGYGQSNNSVPTTNSEILQMVPLKYGYKNNLNFVIPQISSVRVTPEVEQNAVILKGKRSEIIKALGFISLLDQPAYRDRIVGSYKSVFVPITELDKEIRELLKKDGFGSGLDTLPLLSRSMLIMFANDRTLLERAKYWLQKLDVPAEGEAKQYYVFQPLYAKATDLTESLAPLLGGGTTSISTGEEGATNTGRSNNIKSAKNEKITIVVDERSNSLIIYSKGRDYQTILPLIERLDVLPKQVILEVLIAEVTLKDEFAQGLEFFLNENNFTLGNLGSFGEAGIGGLSYILTGSNKWNVNASFSQTNSLFNVISRPSLVVRDGVTASLQVGTDIPIINSTSSPDVGTTTSVQYRKTGLTLSVTPTVNSQGVVIMEIDQQVSNVIIDSKAVTAGGAPSIFTRNMKTEVVANSGQTVILGGLISENNTNSDSRVPGLSDIPILGHLFTSKSEVTDKTELVIMVTPRIIESTQQWDDIKAAMAQQLQQLDISDDNTRGAMQNIKSSKN